MDILPKSRTKRPLEYRSLRRPQARARRPAGPGSQLKPGPEPSQAATKGPARPGYPQSGFAGFWASGPARTTLGRTSTVRKHAESEVGKRSRCSSNCMTHSARGGVYSGPLYPPRARVLAAICLFRFHHLHRRRRRFAGRDPPLLALCAFSPDQIM